MGSPTEAGLMLDAKATMEYVYQELPIDKERVFLFGRSLGGAVAIYAAGLGYPISGVILENTFTNIPDMVNAVMPKIAFLKFLVLRIDWPSLTRIKAITCPIMFISGDKDELVPTKLMQQLYDNATAASDRVLFSVEGGDHNNTWKQAGTSYAIRISSFIKSI
jgi:pimeloyl-ACP methyl ester carboxylesterase